MTLRGKDRGERTAERGGRGGVIPLTAPAGVSGGTVVAGWLTVRFQVAGGGESTATEMKFNLQRTDPKLQGLIKDGRCV